MLKTDSKVKTWPLFTVYTFKYLFLVRIRGTWNQGNCKRHSGRLQLILSLWEENFPFGKVL